MERERDYFHALLHAHGGDPSAIWSIDACTRATSRHPLRSAPMAVDLHDVTDGVWVWRVRHPTRPADAGWPPLVSSTCVESGGEVVLVDPLAPPEDDTAF